MSRIRLRKATAKDSPDVLHWRNDPIAIAVSFQKKCVCYREHAQWYADVLGDKRRRLFIAVNEGGQKIGMIRFDILGDKYAEVSIIIAPAMRGQGFGSKIIDLGTGAMKGFNLIARAKDTNHSSVKVFKKSGYQELFRYDDRAQGIVRVFVRSAK
jgi:UDP-2,4-diacetamido-2,4,6-trideoxy-beta-L-altropyranose hydrolase